MDNLKPLNVHLLWHSQNLGKSLEFWPKRKNIDLLPKKACSLKSSDARQPSQILISISMVLKGKKNMISIFWWFMGISSDLLLKLYHFYRRTKMWNGNSKNASDSQENWYYQIMFLMLTFPIHLTVKQSWWHFGKTITLDFTSLKFLIFILRFIQCVIHYTLMPHMYRTNMDVK